MEYLSRMHALASRGFPHQVQRFALLPLLIPQRNPKLPVVQKMTKGVIRAPSETVPTDGIWARLPTSRKITNVRSSKMISHVYSFKMGLHVQCESTLERDAAYLLDWAPAVASFRSQPERLLFEMDGKLRHTTPDYEVQVFGSVEAGLIEIKYEHQARKIENIVRSHAAHFAAARQGFHYGYLTCREIRSQPRLGNILRLRHYAAVPVSPTLLALVAEHARHWITLGSLKTQAAIFGFDHSQLFALMYWGVLRFDIDDFMNDQLAVSFGAQSNA